MDDMEDMSTIEKINSIRKQLGECGKCLSDKQILQLDMVYRRLARKLIFEYVEQLKKKNNMSKES